jgi:triosephosphate isomerase
MRKKFSLNQILTVVLIGGAALKIEDFSKIIEGFNN